MDFKADLHPWTMGGGIRILSQAIFLSKNPLLCGVIMIIYLLPIETERRTQIVNIKHVWYLRLLIGLPLTWYPR